MEIKCKFRYDKNQSYAYVEDVEITNPGQEIKAFTKINDCYKTSDDIKNFTFKKSPKLQYFPNLKDLNKHFPNLEELIFKKCGIKEISKRDLEGLHYLKKLHLENCRLTSLPDDLFTNMPKLQSVSFADNEIGLASSKLLQPFVGRENISVKFWGNKNIFGNYDSQDINRSKFKSLEGLMEMIDKNCSRANAGEDEEASTEDEDANAIEDYSPAVKKLKLEYGEIFNNLNFSNALEAILFANRLEAINSRELREKAFKIIEVKLAKGPLPKSLMENPSKLKELIECHAKIEKLIES